MTADQDCDDADCSKFLDQNLCPTEVHMIGLDCDMIRQPLAKLTRGTLTKLRTKEKRRLS